MSRTLPKGQIVTIVSVIALIGLAIFLTGHKQKTVRTITSKVLICANKAPSDTSDTVDCSTLKDGEPTATIPTTSTKNNKHEASIENGSSVTVDGIAGDSHKKVFNLVFTDDNSLSYITSDDMDVVIKENPGLPSNTAAEVTYQKVTEKLSSK